MINSIRTLWHRVFVKEAPQPSMTDDLMGDLAGSVGEAAREYRGDVRAGSTPSIAPRSEAAGYARIEEPPPPMAAADTVEPPTPKLAAPAADDQAETDKGGWGALNFGE